MKPGWVYVISNFKRTSLYIGVTNDLERRILEHKAFLGSAFAKKYKLTDLLYFEELPSIANAIEREKQLKNWHRDWKLNLIKQENPRLIDLAKDWFSEEGINEFKANQDYIFKDPETSSG